MRTLDASDLIPNFRDVGGHPTRGGGVVRRGLLYRSTDLSRAAPGAERALTGLGVRTVFDLRTAAERERWPETDRLPDGARYVPADVLRDAPDAPEHDPARLVALFEDPAAAQRLLADGGAERMLTARYRDFVNLTSARQAYHRVLVDLATAERLPAIVHCTTGKDRAGWAVAVLLLLLGVPMDTVMADYLASDAALVPLRREFARQFEAVGGDPGLLEPLLGVRPAYIEAAFDEMRRGFGSIDGYLRSGLAIGPQTRRRLEAIFIAAA